MGDIVGAASQRILEFDQVQQLLRISPHYGFLQQQLQNIALMQGPSHLRTEDQVWIQGCLLGQMLFLQVTTNLLYHCFVESLRWLSSKVEQEWKIHHFEHGWW